MSYYSFRRAARRQYRWGQQKKRRKQEQARRAAGRQRPMTCGETLKGLALCFGLWVALRIVLYALLHPIFGVGLIVAVIVAAAVVIDIGGRERRRAVEGRSAQAARPAAVGREENRERLLVQAWMEAAVREGGDARVRRMARAYLEDEHELRALRAERIRRTERG